jgi:hypothetical protein
VQVLPDEWQKGESIKFTKEGQFLQANEARDMHMRELSYELTKERDN